MNIRANSEDFNGIILQEHDGQITTTSRDVAKRFGKEHYRVLRAIRELDCSAEFNAANFGVVEYIDAKGETRTEYAMTRDGFTFLAMGFTGKDVAAWKEKYIAAFNAMEAQLRAARQTVALDLNDPSQLVPLLASYAERTQVAEARVSELSPKAIAYDRLDTADGDLTLRPASKVLGYPERKLAHWLQVNRWAFRQGGKGPLQAYVDKRNMGYLDHKLHSYADERTGDYKVSVTLVITPKGLAKLAKLLPTSGGAA